MSSFTIEKTLEIPPYPENSPGHENVQGTYWPNLNEKNKAAFDIVQTWAKENNIDLPGLAPYAVDQRLTILRYLRANNFDTKKAMEHMSKNIEWRNEMDVKEIVKCRPEEILGCEMKPLHDIFPHWQYGYDRTGRPVVYKHYAKFDATKIKEMGGGSFDSMMKYHVWEQEAVSKMCLEQTEKLGELVETITGIVDIKDMRLSQVTRDFLALIRCGADIDQKQYPETLGRIYIINAPALFPMVWGWVKPWLDPITTSKIFILGGPDKYLPILDDFIGKANLPSNYEGDLPALETLAHPYVHTMQTLEALSTEEHDQLAILTDKNIAQNQHNAMVGGEDEEEREGVEVDTVMAEIVASLKDTELDDNKQ